MRAAADVSVVDSESLGYAADVGSCDAPGGAGLPRKGTETAHCKEPAMATPAIKVLVARDPDLGSRVAPQILASLSSSKWALACASGDDRALEMLEAYETDVCLLDRAEAPSSLVFLRAAQAQGCRVPIIVLVAAPTDTLVDQMLAAGAADILSDTELTGPVLERSIRYARDRARFGEALRASWRRFKALLEHSAEGLSVLGEGGKVRYANDCVRQIVGYSAHELIGKYLFDFIHPDDAERVQHLFNECVGLPSMPITAVFRLRHRDGRWRNIDCVFSSYMDDPDMRGVVANYRDVTDESVTVAQWQH
jgi:PAS domain S-box-containing protein